MNRKKYAVITILALIHQTVTYFMDKSIFTVSPSQNITDYIICRICAFIAAWFFYHMLWQLFIDSNRKNNTITRVILSALPYLAVIIVVSAVKLRGGYLSNDETLIYQNAVSLTHYTWFYYITTYYYIISLMLIPHMYGPIFVKLVIEYLVIGYVVLRVSDYYKARSKDPLISKPVRIGYGSMILLLFLLYPVIAYTTSAHRLPIYFLLYLFMMVMLLFDKLEKSTLTVLKAVFLLILNAILTQWRTEGIYLAVLVPILMFLTYKNIRLGKDRTVSLRKGIPAVIVILLSILVQYVVSIPQNGFIAKEMGAAADDRMKPFYAYTITNMYRNGLDMDKNAGDLAIVDRYISMESLDAINEYYGDINYEDVLILYQPGFIGVRENAGVTEYYDFVNALKRIFINNPQVFIRTRIGAFKYAALPYRIAFSGTDIRSLTSFVISIIKSVSYNLFIPLVIILLLLFYSLIKGRWFSFFVMGGLLAHWFIVFVLAPASYFKYYFPVYITAYLYLFLLIIEQIYNKKHPVKIRMLQ